MIVWYQASRYQYYGLHAYLPSTLVKKSPLNSCKESKIDSTGGNRRFISIVLRHCRCSVHYHGSSREKCRKLHIKSDVRTHTETSYKIQHGLFAKQQSSTVSMALYQYPSPDAPTAGDLGCRRGVSALRGAPELQLAWQWEPCTRHFIESWLTLCYSCESFCILRSSLDQPEWRARNVVQPSLCKECDWRRLSTMLSTDAHLFAADSTKQWNHDFF